jgi:energy-coupling factor transporter ATP-binding protein EcfA2
MFLRKMRELRGRGPCATRVEGSDRPLIREIEIEGFKSIERLKLELGRVTVLIGENGCGKSNILEAIAFASAAHAGRLGHEFLASRGIRTPEPRLMRPAFDGAGSAPMQITFLGNNDRRVTLGFSEDASSTVPVWTAEITAFDNTDDVGSFIREMVANAFSQDPNASWIHRKALEDAYRAGLISGVVGDAVDEFLVFSPENSALRTFEREGQILPIGINGEGLFAHLRALERAGKVEVLSELNHRLDLIDWFSSFEIPADLGPGEHRLSIRDRYVATDVLLDQRSANEGFLFLLFYYTLLLSPDTPKFFAIDNIDASLNPRLCARLMSDVVELAKRQDRQVVVTTHNPAVLDGLDLADDEQRLVVVSRTQRGTTRARRVPASRPIEGAPSQRLSEAFIRGFLGGLPDNF